MEYRRSVVGGLKLASDLHQLNEEYELDSDK